MKKTVYALVAILILYLFSVTPVWSHDLWISLSSYHPEPGEELTVSMKEGHSFPCGEAFEAGKLARIYLIEPDGTEKTLPILAEGNRKLLKPIKITLKKQGTYLLVAEKKSYFVTKTTTGTLYEPKDKVSGAISSYYSEFIAKAVFTVGKPFGQSFQKRIGAFFQITPKKNPDLLHAGDSIAIESSYKTENCEGEVWATYEGYVPENHSHAHSTHVHSHDYPLVLKSDTHRDALIKLSRKGKWLIGSSREIPYSDKKKADRYMLKSTLTFEVQ